MTGREEVEAIARHVEALALSRQGRVVGLTVGLAPPLDVIGFRAALLTRLSAFHLDDTALSTVHDDAGVRLLAVEFAR